MFIQNYVSACKHVSRNNFSWKLYTQMTLVNNNCNKKLDAFQLFFEKINQVENSVASKF